MTKVVSPTIYSLWWSVALVWEDSAGDCLEGSRDEGDVSAIGKHPALKRLQLYRFFWKWVLQQTWQSLYLFNKKAVFSDHEQTGSSAYIQIVRSLSRDEMSWRWVRGFYSSLRKVIADLANTTMAREPKAFLYVSSRRCLLIFISSTPEGKVTNKHHVMLTSNDVVTSTQLVILRLKAPLWLLQYTHTIT